MTRDHDQVQFGNTTISYRILRKPSRKTIEIKVHPDCSITVSAPAGTRHSTLSAVVRKKADWIIRKQWQVSRFQKYAPRRFVSGESYFYLGRQYQLKVHQSEDPTSNQNIKFHNGRFEVTVPSSWSVRRKDEAVQSLLAGWYREQATKKIPPMVDRISAQAGLQLSRLIIKEMKQRWGSCGKDGTVRINWRIMMGALALVEYVIAHEVCHLALKDHSDAFWKNMEKIMPDYETRRERLAGEGGRFQL